MKGNRYDWLLLVMVALLIFGNVGNGAQPIRLMILAVAPVMMVDAVRRPHASLRYYAFECFFLAAWWLWAAAFYFMAEDPSESLKHLVYLAIHILGLLEVLWAASKATNPQHYLKYGWLLMLACSIPIALSEFLTDTHLATSLWDSGASVEIGGVKVMRPFAAVTFGNLNTYNTVLCMAFPSLFFCNLFPKNKPDKVLGLLLMLCVVLIVVANSSRAAIMCMAVMMMAFVYCYYKTGRNRVLLITVITLVIIALVYFLFDVFFLIVARFADQGVADDGRMENIVKGLSALMSRGGLGIGIGNYEPVMNNEYRVLYAAPHNFFLEIAVVYGIPVFCGFVWMMVRAFRRGLQGTTFNRDMLLLCSFACVFACIIDSQYVMKAHTWMFLATMLVYTDRRYNREEI